MGNTHSISSTRRNTHSLRSDLTEPPCISNSSPQDVTDTSGVNLAPTENEEGDPPPRNIQRGRSLIKFPSLRRRPLSVAGLNDQSQDTGSSSPSRRRWRAFNGLKSRPVSSLGEAISPAIDSQSPQGDLQQPATGPNSNDKGKGREKDLSEISHTNGSNDLRSIHNAAGPSTIENEETVTSSEAMLQELRELQDAVSTKDGLQSDIPVDSKTDADPFDRPSTPIPNSGMDSPSSRGNDVPDNPSRTALAEALGSWLSGRPRTDNPESGLNDLPVASSSRPHGIDPLSMYGNARPRHNNGPDPSSSSYAAGALSSPFMPGSAPEPYASGRGIGQSSSSPRAATLPPAGTGTLVVVQGVVHTTDVRQSPSRTPTIQPTGSYPSYPPRSTSSTPTLRPSTLGAPSLSGSGASTPQPLSTPRRRRFLSLASGLRQRSRPHTPTSLRTAGPGSWRHGSGDTGSGSFIHSETASERSLGLGLAAERRVSDCEPESAALTPGASSTGAFVSTDHTSNIEPAANPSGEEHASNVSTTSQAGSRVQNGSENLETLPNINNGGEQRTMDDRERDSTSDDEGDAELSASSIEILGTLLSVATAATAASLVTGTTEPLFSSGLAGSSPNGRNSTSTAPTASTTNPPPSLPRPSYQSSPPVSPIGADSGNEAAANTRMRAAWESLRDRFSRTRGRRASTAGEVLGGPREDPREQMLREMARVFNMRLGLEQEGPSEPRPEQHENRTSEGLPNESSSPATSQPSHEPVAEASNSPPLEPRTTGSEPGPEGSFERFLHNLQVDLRTALTEDYAARRARAQAWGLRANAQAAASPTNPPSASRPLADSVTLEPPDSTPAPAPEEGLDQDVPISRPSLPHNPDLVPTVPNTPRTANLDLPHLSGDESQSTNGTPPQAQGITGQPGAGINWWRLYRFPPMQVNPHPSTAGADAPSASSVFSSPQPSPPTPSQNPTRVSPSDARPSPIDGNFPQGPESPPTQNLVPVIVVGLQSVPVSRVEAHHYDTPTPFGSRYNDPSSDTDPPVDAPGRDRPWPLRAASRAFNRMGRRADADLPSDSDMNPLDVNAAEHPGTQTRRIGRQSGRTYLIFVIGGYYPPNHSIVTGADDMNSFEALWELADLLGQVKPPVASKEDIEKSGLEIIKPSSLFEYERSGKVASNTVERCLICLDDYEQEDDLRLLSCRHVFHKLCVDKWLEQGRNNCPACRSKGVQTGDDPPTSSLPFEAPL